MNVLQIDGVINNGVSFLNGSTRELQNLAQLQCDEFEPEFSRQFATTRDSVVRSFVDLVNCAHKEGLAGAIGSARVKAHDTLVVSSSSYFL